MTKKLKGNILAMFGRGQKATMNSPAVFLQGHILIAKGNVKVKQ